VKRRRLGWTVKGDFGNREAGKVGKFIWRLGACYTRPVGVLSIQFGHI
jgi:hypothetical protein